MSDYVHEKVIRLKITDEIVEKFNYEVIDDFIDDFDDFIMREHPELSMINLNSNGTYEYYRDRFPRFEIGYGCWDRYIDLLLFQSYGEESNDWGIVSMLSDKEKDTFVPYFETIGLEINPDDLRKVDYCWYNCSEPPDYYDLNESKDDWSKYINN